MRIRGALEVIQTSLIGTRGDDVRWNLGWRDALRRIKVDEVMKSCKEIGFDGSDGEKREAKVVARLMRRGREFVKQIDSVESEMADLYPVEKARHRLDTEIGWESAPNDTIATKLDRSCMIARVNAPPPHALRAKAHGIVRGRFNDLEMSEDVS